MSEGKTTHKLHIMPLPEGGEISPTEALRWLQEDFGPYQQVATMTAAGGKDEEERQAGCHLGMDVQTMVEGCAEALESNKPVVFEREYMNNALEYPEHTLKLTHVVRAKHVFFGESGPFVWAYDELATELARRVAEPIEAEQKRRATEWKPRKPPLSSLSPEEQALHGCE